MSDATNFFVSERKLLISFVLTRRKSLDNQDVTRHVTRVTQITYSEPKMIELILYIADRCALDDYYGVLKLNKILFYSDFRAYRTLGAPITGAVYRKYPHGPAPEGMKPLKQRLIDKDVAVEWHQFLRVADGRKAEEKRLFAKRKPKQNALPKKEREIVDEVIQWLRPFTGTDVSKLSHKHPGWAMVAHGARIPYAAALLDEQGRPRPITGESLVWAKKVAHEYGAGTARYQAAP